MDCSSLMIFPYCFLHHSKEKTKKKQKKEKMIRIYLYHWRKMKTIKSFSFASPYLGGVGCHCLLQYLGGLTLNYPSKGILVLMEQKRESLFAFFFFFFCNNKISFICLITALDETSNWLLVGRVLPPPHK